MDYTAYPLKSKLRKGCGFPGQKNIYVYTSDPRGPEIFVPRTQLTSFRGVTNFHGHPSTSLFIDYKSRVLHSHIVMALLRDIWNPAKQLDKTVQTNQFVVANCGAKISPSSFLMIGINNQMSKKVFKKKHITHRHLQFANQLLAD